MVANIANGIDGTQTQSRGPLDVIIVGGSLGGLSTGLALKRFGHKTTILERNPTPLLQNQGAGIVAGGDTTDFLERFNRCDRPIKVSSQQRQYFDREGNVVHKVDMLQNMTSWDLMYYLLRANYDEIESDYCEVPKRQTTDGAFRYLYGHTFTHVTEEDEGRKVRVHFNLEDGSQGSLVGDMLVGADGPSSHVRRQFEPESKREMCGYCVLRGTQLESEATRRAQEAFCGKFSFFHDSPGIQFLCYLIPGKNGTVEAGQRLINFVCYKNFPVDSKEFEELMTDTDGRRHSITMPPGKMKWDVWEKQLADMKKVLPPQCYDLANGVEQPFVQAVTDAIASRNTFLGGKVVLIGDALAGFRPHTVASTSQACFDASILADYLDGQITEAEFIQGTMQFARLLHARGKYMGHRSQFVELPLKELIADRDRASVKRKDEVYPDWAKVF